MSYTYAYARPALTVDCIVFGLDGGTLKVLLIQRKSPPFEAQWALPGGFVELQETLDEAARRELLEETGVENIFLEQLYTFGGVDRDPRERIISVAYYALINLEAHPLQAASDAEDARWFPVRQLPALAFDHAEIFCVALQRLQGKLSYEPIGFELLPSKFTLTQLQQLYETVLERSLDKRNFRKKILKLECLTPLPEKQQNVRHRAAQFYQFDEQRYRQHRQQGFVFDL
ncbi:MAG: NUDIX hydrolase [Synechococcales cyanobacterium CRU_2_2]|nr:NUDIX hydrolase [Synechococcales cyanobacterium CRU_2_2]